MSFLKNKNKFIFVLVIFFWLVSIASFFIWGKICKAEPILKITNVQFSGGAGKTDEDFIEITNTTENELNLNEYKLVKKTSSGTRTSIVSFSNEDSIPPEKTYLWASSKNDDFPKKIGADIWREETISENNGIAIILGNKDTGVIIDSLNWKKEDEPEDEDVSPEETVDYSKIKINEIYPVPNTKNGEEEFVEIIDESEKTPDFSDWTIKDSKGAKGKISRYKKDGAFIVFYGSFSLNNDSKGDTVFLYDKKGNLIASQKYATGKSAYSYSFDRSTWRWTPHITPNAKNEFAEILSGKIKKDKTIYAGAYANFEVTDSKNAKKFTWNFGDGHKSYLKKTRHKYEKTGKYNASLKISGNGEDNLINFEVEVKKYHAPKIRITSLSANPKGLDKNEFILIENKSTKKVNLKGWSVATGWKKLINHPIRENFEIKAGKSKKLTKKICAFTLVNTKDKIELRDPSGKIVQKIKYDHGKKSISDDEIYTKIDSNWQWIETQTEQIEKETNNPKDILPANETELKTEQLKTNEENPIQVDINLSDLGKSTENPAWQAKQKNQIILLLADSNIDSEKFLSQNQGKVLGISKVNPTQYHQTEDNQIKLNRLNQFWKKINAKLNQLVLMF